MLEENGFQDEEAKRLFDQSPEMIDSKLFKQVSFPFLLSTTLLLLLADLLNLTGVLTDQTLVLW